MGNEQVTSLLVLNWLTDLWPSLMGGNATMLLELLTRIKIGLDFFYMLGDKSYITGRQVLPSNIGVSGIGDVFIYH